MIAFFVSVLIIALAYMALQSLVAVLRLFGMAWNGLEALLNGLWRGLILTWRLTRWTARMGLLCVRGAIAAARGAQAFDTWLSRHAHLFAFVQGYRLKRNYIAQRLRQMRAARTKRAG